ncbi:MAG: hypothetical protein KJ823_08330 [Proteobacteria bacterium]|nr:hypothetical protein [Desulfobacteraceae bacterium]MBU0990181.1 hypothetical protein [Pseudomonadota bacterium]
MCAFDISMDKKRSTCSVFFCTKFGFGVGIAGFFLPGSWALYTGGIGNASRLLGFRFSRGVFERK